MLPQIPRPAVLMPVGAAGSGKSTFARAFPPSWILSADSLRGQIADDPGDQAASQDAWTALHLLLGYRLRRARSAVVDATNTGVADRRALLDIADQHGVPAVAVTMPATREQCHRRNRIRPAARRVPASVLDRQFDLAAVSHQALLDEGFSAVHCAADLPVLRHVLQRAAASGREHGAPDVRAAFGDDLAAFLTWEPDSGPGDWYGALAIGGESLAIRQVEREYDFGFEAGVRCWQPLCPAPAWTPVRDAADLLAAYDGLPTDDITCDACDT
ncbi:AAA family ATPase [Streptomyces sp. NPDC059096]|uniref:AAA family ATPase n=1 Tax=Streptomyces sp. NPDC059096 TaxID=3346727 RepID=UPI0036CBC356